MASSRGEATVSAMTFGLAPGNCARTITEGGMISGYSANGSLKIEIRPASRMTTDRTPANMGRSMKNFEVFTTLTGTLDFKRRFEMRWRAVPWRSHEAEPSHWL